ncbi:MAG: ATP-binding protein, partial [Hylemonella sp.]
VSHEIRTPLTVLAGFIETLQTLPLNPDERAKYLGLMAEQSQRMQSLVGDLLTLSRLEASPLPDANAAVQVRPLMDQLAQEAAALSAASAHAQQPVHALQFMTPPPFEITGSAPELHSALSNLVSNAVRYTPAGGEVRVEWLLHADGRASFKVQDSGPGIAPEHLPRLTERFYRVDRSRSRDSGGTGLGLAIVKHVAQRHDSELRIESTPGKGSSFTIVFPASRLHHLQEAAPPANASAASVG